MVVFHERRLVYIKCGATSSAAADPNADRYHDSKSLLIILTVAERSGSSSKNLAGDWSRACPSSSRS